MVINNANLEFGKLSKRKKTTLLVMHHAAGNGPVTQIHDYHRSKGWSGIGYHFYVRKDGSVWQGRPIDTVGAHTVDFNSLSVGVCFEGNFETEQMPAVQISAGAELIAHIRKLYPSIIDVRGHGELRNTACPGKNFPMATMLNAAETPAIVTVKQFQLAAIADGFKFPEYGADGLWGSESESVAKKAICKKRLTYKYRNLTRLIQKAVEVEVDGKFGNDTKNAVITYQKAHGLYADGIVGLNTWRRILGV